MDEPYRRGAIPGAAAAAPREGGAYETFSPEPEDRAVVRPGDEAPAARVDRYLDAGSAAEASPVEASAVDAPSVEAPAGEPALRRGKLVPDEDEPLVAPLPPLSWDPPPPAVEEPAPYVEPGYAQREEPEHLDYYDDAAYAAEDPYYSYEADLDEPQRTRVSAVAVLGLLVLGVVALFGGALLAGIFNDRGVGGLTPTPSPTLSSQPTVAATPSVVPSESAGPTSTPQASDGSVAFSDGFQAHTAACQPGKADLNGCTASGATNNGDVWIWVGFRKGTASDVLSAKLTTAAGEPIGDGTIDLAGIGCKPDCPGGWTYFQFENLKPGKYIVRVTRNGEPAARTSFEVKA